jgi:hypothetical protein
LKGKKLFRTFLHLADQLIYSKKGILLFKQFALSLASPHIGTNHNEGQHEAGLITVGQIGAHPQKIINTESINMRKVVT